MEEIWQKIVHWSSDIIYIALHNLLFQAYSWNKPGEKRRGLCKGLAARIADGYLSCSKHANGKSRLKKLQAMTFSCKFKKITENDIKLRTYRRFFCFGFVQ